MTKKQEKIIFCFLLLLLGGIIVCSGKCLWEIYKPNKNMIHLQLEHVADRPAEVVENAFIEMKEKWDFSDYCTIYEEFLFMNKEGKIDRITLELLDNDDIHYTINISDNSQNPEIIDVFISKNEQINFNGQIWAQGIPFYKNLEFLTYLQTEYSFEHDCHIQYYNFPQKNWPTPESKVADFETLVLHNSESDAYYCFFTFERGEKIVWDNKFAILIPVH